MACYFKHVIFAFVVFGTVKAARLDDELHADPQPGATTTTKVPTNSGIVEKRMKDYAAQAGAKPCDLPQMPTTAAPTTAAPKSLMEPDLKLNSLVHNDKNLTDEPAVSVTGQPMGDMVLLTRGKTTKDLDAEITALRKELDDFKAKDSPCKENAALPKVTFPSLDADTATTGEPPAAPDAPGSASASAAGSATGSGSATASLVDGMNLDACSSTLDASSAAKPEASMPAMDIPALDTSKERIEDDLMKAAGIVTAISPSIGSSLLQPDDDGSASSSLEERKATMASSSFSSVTDPTHLTAPWATQGILNPIDIADPMAGEADKSHFQLNTFEEGDGFVAPHPPPENRESFRGAKADPPSNWNENTAVNGEVEQAVHSALGDDYATRYANYHHAEGPYELFPSITSSKDVDGKVAAMDAYVKADEADLGFAKIA